MPCGGFGERVVNTMAESKNYIVQPQEGGNILISEDVIASIAAAAVTDVDGVCGLSANMAELLNKKSQTKGVRLTVGENDSITIDCNVIALYGHPVMELAKEIQNAVSDAIAAMTGLQVTAVNVNICGIAMARTPR